jgi:hypothetical protein
MQAYEFYAIPKNGVIIIPDKYRNKIKTGVTVILLEGKLSANEISHKRTELLSPISIDTRGWKFDKEEANE